VPAAVNERDVADELLEGGPPPRDLLLDKGFTGKAFTAAQAGRGTAVLLPPARAQRHRMPPILQKIIAEWRNRIETTFQEITDQMELARHGAHTFWGLLTRTAATIAGPAPAPGPPPRRTPHGRPARTPRRAGPPRPGNAAVRDLDPGLLPQPLRDPAPRRDLRHRLGECLLRAVPRPALPAALDQEQRHLPGTVPDIPRPGRHVLVHVLRDRAAPRARRGARRHRPHRDPPVGLALHLGDPQPGHAEQRRGHILGRRGFPAISDLHKSGSWDPRPRIRRKDTPRDATTQLQSAGCAGPGRPGRSSASAGAPHRLHPRQATPDANPSPGRTRLVTGPKPDPG
jgi:hypothetical protein